MKITYQSFNSAVKTKSEPSGVVSGLWLARSAIGININNCIQPMLGFAAGLDRHKCENGSSYELLERLLFSPHVYDEKSLNKAVVYLSEGLVLLETQGYIKDFLVGSTGPQGSFYGNGCAVFDNVSQAVSHSRCELIERHICCELWYKKSLRLVPESQYKVTLLMPSVKIAFYTISDIREGKFAIAVLDCNETGFFVIGAAIRSNLRAAYEHALSEAAMIFEDFIKGRAGCNVLQEAQRKILSLRDQKLSEERRRYFHDLTSQSFDAHFVPAGCQSIFFEPLPGIYAARTFSANAGDPRLFEAQDIIPTLPLF